MLPMANSQPTAERLAIALDTSDLDQALFWAKSVKGFFGVAKIGLQLFSAHGPRVIEGFLRMEFKVFLDLKFHDIPATVEKSSRVVGGLGISYLTVHAAGGVDMVSASLKGLREGSHAVGAATPLLLGVTVLTSERVVTDDVFRERVSVLADAGAEGLVCAAQDITLIDSFSPEFIKVVPGIRASGALTNDQARVATPSGAIAAGADLLVVGRPITESKDPRLVAEQVFLEVQNATT